MPSSSGRDRVGRAVVLTGCVVAGLTEWSIFVVGKTGDDSISSALWLCLLVTVAVVGVVFEGRAVEIAGATFGGPLVAAQWTFPRGDNDGLWGLIFVVIVAVAAFGVLVVVLARRVVPARWAREATETFVGRHVWIASAVVVVGGAGSLLLLAERRADPYPALERVAAYFPAPGSFQLRAEHRGGDPLCNAACGAFVETTFTTTESPRAACTTAKATLTKWRNAAVKPSEPIFNPQLSYREVCSWNIGYNGIEGWVTVSDEADGTVARLMLNDPRGRRR